MQFVVKCILGGHKDERWVGASYFLQVVYEFCSTILRYLVLKHYQNQLYFEGRVEHILLHFSHSIFLDALHDASILA